MTRSHRDEFERLVAGYFDHTLDEAERGAFARLLREDDALVQRFAELSQLHQMIQMEMAFRREAERFGSDLASDGSGAARALAELARLHETGVQAPVDFAAWRDQQLRHKAAKRRKQRQARAILVAAAAAVVAVAVILGIALSSGPAAPPIAGVQAQSQAPSIVATLTDAKQARWQNDAGDLLSLAPGDALRSGQRLVLTAGYAQITTNRGAVATIQAPAQLELLDHDNALRLEAGKMVGLCENDASKGFLVRTPHLDVTDLGTSFGIDATLPEQTEVHVFTGSVQASRSSSGSSSGSSRPGSTMLLIQGSAARATQADRQLLAIDTDAQRFASIPGIPSRIDLPGTGLGLAMGEIDPRWQVTHANGELLDPPAELVVAKPPNASAIPLPPNRPSRSQWLAPTGPLAELNRREIPFTCRTFFDLPETIDLDAAQLVMQFDADDRVVLIRVNGQAVTPPPNRVTDPRVELNELVIEGLVQPGRNTVEFDVIDVVRNNGWYWGMRVQWYLQFDHDSTSSTLGENRL